MAGKSSSLSANMIHTSPWWREPLQEYVQLKEMCGSFEYPSGESKLKATDTNTCSNPSRRLPLSQPGPGNTFLAFWGGQKSRQNSEATRSIRFGPTAKATPSIPAPVHWSTPGSPLVCCALLLSAVFFVFAVYVLVASLCVAVFMLFFLFLLLSLSSSISCCI